MNLLFDEFNKLFNNEKLKEELKSKTSVLHFKGCISSSKALLYGNFKDDFQKKIILCCDEIKAREVEKQIRMFCTRPLLFPEIDMLFSKSNVKNNVIEEQRMSVIKELLSHKSCTVVTTINALFYKLPNLDSFNLSSLKFKVGMEYKIDDILNELVKIGYERDACAQVSGTFALRGGIIDIFPISENNPVRIEFFGDEIESIRYFDASTQRSISEIKSINIFPIKLDESAISFLDYFNTDNSLVVMDEPNTLINVMEASVRELSESIDRRIENGEEVDSLEKFSFYEKDIVTKLSKYSILALDSLDNKINFFDTRKVNDINIEINANISFKRSIEDLTKTLKRLKKEKYKIVLMSSSKSRAKNLQKSLLEYDIMAEIRELFDSQIKPCEIVVVTGSLSNGFTMSKEKFSLITDMDIFGATSVKKRRKKKSEGQKLNSFSDLNVNDYVVHEDYGIGRYRGIENIDSNNKSTDYMVIEYAGSEKLYIPVTNFNVIQKYASSSASVPKLSRIGTKAWKETKNKVKESVDEIAKDLVLLYANRQNQSGYIFDGDTVWQKEFEDSFEFEETDDQIRAIEDVKRDMESDKIMDRLICGDVGYGKTEVALRAAFKAVQENKQVAYLVPTTILAKQHYDNFVERLENFPVSIELLCRFRTKSEQDKTVKKLKNGTVDIVIGTHRLLSSDVSFKDLGLLIIDEEQRFGVKHKEKIKKLRENVDVLTLSATPIPRTLHMSLVGIRSMSVLEEPPRDRQAIQTYVMDYDEETIREAIVREIRRHGQVYYVFNNIKGIAEMARKIALLVPGARVDFVHGRMNENELEDKMYQFIDGEIDVLVSTTIIEMGLDISNVNTMLIHDADRMGLSQLYQLRGRVGRSNRSSYCFLLTNKNKVLNEDAMKRLETIRQFTALGSGFKIAMKDLEIRGAGNMLGKSQSGHMASVGYDLYCKMLKVAVKEQKGETKFSDYFETTIDIHCDAYIPETYIENENIKLDIYKDISGIETLEEKEEMIETLADRFGKAPKAVIKLIDIALLKANAHKIGIEEINEKQNEIQFVFYEKSEVNPESIISLVNESKDYRLINEKSPILIYFKKKHKYTDIEIIEIVNKILSKLY